MSNNVDQSDQQLLQSFIVDKDRDALERLITRHSSLVFRTCRRVLGARQHAEDAFQATFLILVTRPPSPRKTHSIAGWLYRVAWRTSLRIATARHRDADFDIEEAVSSVSEPFIEIQRRELMRVLDEELNALPERYRDVIVLCHLEGKSRAQAAAELGRTEASVKASLTRGRDLLRMRLIRRRVFPAMAVAAVVSSLSDSAEARPLVAATIDSCAQGNTKLRVRSDIQSVLNSGVGRMNFSSGIKLAVSTIGASLLIATMVTFGGSAGASDGEDQSGSHLQISTVVIEDAEESDIDEFSARTVATSNSNSAMDDSTADYKLATAAALRTKAKAKLIEAEAMTADLAKRAEMLDASRRLWALGESAELEARARQLEYEVQCSRSNGNAKNQPNQESQRNATRPPKTTGMAIYGPPRTGLQQEPLRVGDTVRIEEMVQGGLTKRQFKIDSDGMITLEPSTRLKAAGLKLIELGHRIQNASRE